MRGVVFTELIEFVEENLGFEIADKMIENAQLENDGSFTQGGNYKFEELVKLVVSLSQATGKEVDELLVIFGRHMFHRLVGIYNKDIKSIHKTPIEFIANVEGLVHVEVKKLYPDVDLPRFITKERTDTSLVLHYISDKPLESFAYGLMIGCGEFYEQSLDVDFKTVEQAPKKVVEFNIKVQ